MPKTKIPYYHPLTDWMLGATVGNQGQQKIIFKSSEAILHLY